MSRLLHYTLAFLTAFISITTCVFGQVNVVTQHNDIGRTGQNTNETILTTANVSGGNFGKLFSVSVDGQVYAQPLYLSGVSIPGAGTHNVVFTVTMHDSVYAFDADSGTLLWQITLLDAAHGASAGATTDQTADTGCTELAGTEFGITSTPVIDPVGGVIYVVGKTFENNYPVQRLHALSITTGAELANSPVTITASVTGTGTGSSGGALNFDPKWENQRAGLLLLNGIVYIGFASYCDVGPWHGWILAYNTATMQQTSVFTPTPNSEGSGIWLSGTGLAADVPSGSPFGRMFIATGNGTYDATQPYGTNTMDYGVDVIRLDLTNGVMKVTDAFTPFDQANLNQNDQDLASGGVMLLPDSTLTGHPHQLLAAGKTGNIYVVDRDSLGGYSTTSNNIVEYIAPNQIGGVFSVPAYWNNTVYYWGDEDTLKQFSFTNGLMNAWHLVNSSESLSFPGAVPSISSNGNTNGIVWAIDSSAWVNGGNANLLAHDATNVATTLYTSASNPARDNPGLAVKFAVPTIVNGKVYVGAYGQLSVYGLLSANFSLSAATTSVSVPQGGSTTDTITVNPIGGFTGSVSLSTGALPTGVSAAFAAGAIAGTTNVTFTATNTATAGSYPVVITGTSGALTNSITVGVTVTSPAAPSFTLALNPSSLALVQGTSGVTTVTITPKNGFAGTVNFSASGLPNGAGGTFTSTSSSSVSFGITVSSTVAVGNYPITITGTSSNLSANAQFTLQVTASPSFALTASAAALTLVTGQSGTSTISVVPANGFASAVNLGVSGVPSGVTASFGTNPTSTSSLLTLAVSSLAATGTSALTITGTSGNLTASQNISLTVTQASCSPTAITPYIYLSSTGTTQQTANITVSSTNTLVTLEPQPLTGGSWSWTGPNGYSSTARQINDIPLSLGANTYTATYTNPSGCKSTQAFVITVTGSAAPVSVNLSSVFNVHGIYPNGTIPRFGGLDNDGYAYSSSLIGTSVSWSGYPFTLAGSGVADAVAGGTISLPGGSYSTIKILAAGVNGVQFNQTFIVTYSDGTTSRFVQSLSDWGAESNIAGESIAVTMPYRVTYNGGTQNGPWHLYGYSFTLNSGKSVRSITLPNNRNVVVLAITL